MCGRYSLGHPDQLALRFDVSPEDVPAVGRYNIAPGQDIPVIVERPEGRALWRMRWGFRPAWAAKGSRRSAPINARAETLQERTLFRQALARHRCIIPADGFFEWQELPGQRSKQPVYIRRRDGGLVGFAGLYTLEQDDDGRLNATAAIITTTPNSLMAPIHTRMPAILDPVDEALWLDPEVRSPDGAVSCLRPYPADLLEAYEVSAAVSSVRNDSPSLVLPLTAGAVHAGGPPV